MDLDTRERELLQLYASEPNANYSFQGLRRRLGFHQETLTRTLKRLEQASVLERTTDGYRLKDVQHTYTFTVGTNQVLNKPLIDAYLPSQIDVTILFQKLRGRWFSNFRWLGYTQDGNQLSMSWISEDGHMQLQAHIRSGKITITADPPNGNEQRQIAAAYQLFDHISKIAEDMIQHADQTPAVN
jgi:hypothetical protein